MNSSTMAPNIDIAKSGTEGVRRLRLQKLQSGHPFMINARDLPTGQFYLEFPDGHIVLAMIKNSSVDFTILRDLPLAEQQELRITYNLPL